jgi:hypothetical protein
VWSLTSHNPIGLQGLLRDNFTFLLTDIEVEVKLRPTVNRPVCLGVRRPSGTRDQFLFLLEMFFRQLWVCYFVAPFLARGRVCNLLVLLILASVVPRDWRPYFIVPILETPPTWRARFPYLYLPRTSWPRYTPGTGFPFRLLLRLAGLRWKYSIQPPHGCFKNLCRHLSYYCHIHPVLDNDRKVSKYMAVVKNSWSTTSIQHAWLHIEVDRRDSNLSHYLCNCVRQTN